MAAKGLEVGERPDDHQEITLEASHPANGSRRHGKLQAVCPLLDHGTGQKLGEMGFTAHRTGAGAAAAMGGGEGFMEI